MSLRQTKVKSSSAKFKHGFKSWAERKSISTRAEMGLSPHDFLCAFELSKHLKIPIFTPNDIDGLSKENLSNLLGEGSTKWSAAVIVSGITSFCIIHNPTHSVQRQQSNIMHEIAHILCGHSLAQANANSTLNTLMREYNKEQENEADWLGSCLQLPRQALIWSLHRHLGPKEISEKYSASIQMVNYRIGITGADRQFKRST
ncbi:MAG: ImmA/IrrE family metallo-endopeptidase [Chitinophagales bacterium]|nr:ImmA/IrrE family metallo-endopeptidase [Chitinophagales bacterium]